MELIQTLILQPIS